MKRSFARITMERALIFFTVPIGSPAFFGVVMVRNMRNPAVNKIFRRAAVKGLCGVRREGETDISHAFLRVFRGEY